jgi:hypothetical protein
VPKDSTADSPFSPVDGAAFVDGPVQSAPALYLKRSKNETPNGCGTSSKQRIARCRSVASQAVFCLSKRRFKIADLPSAIPAHLEHGEPNLLRSIVLHPWSMSLIRFRLLL